MYGDYIATIKLMTNMTKKSLEQLERLRSEDNPTTPWLPILLSHLGSKQDRVKATNLKKWPKVQFLEFCNKLPHATHSEVAR